MRRISAALAVGIVLVGAAACLPSDPGPRGVVGVRLISGGALAVAVQPCDAHALIDSVALKASLGSRQTIWLIKSQAGSPLTRFVAGIVPPGFAQSNPLTTDLAPNQTYAVLVTTRDGFEFGLGGIRPSRLDVNDWYVGSSHFVADHAFDELTPCG